ncbi:MAG: hypothetical protein QOI38_2057 [Sphingomonadales bacterium]|jgi:hypothetical protein|nr:hypothetical protein [Sphingomonadales bacterium]
MTPGVYIRLRRLAAGMTTQDVMRSIGVNELRLSASLTALEEDRTKSSYADARVLATIFPLSPAIVSELGCGGNPPICRSCGCSEFDPCGEPGAGYCFWQAPDLCSSCPATPARSAAA